ncbi:MAG: heavy metal translocating P-type ATPase [Deltaproteobacteria bacterium]|nr:heavy metal translocating P-type ATPase [Deltaproteobacteria bacterium]
MLAEMRGAKATQATGGQIAVLTIESMGCEGCAAVVETALRAERGVREVQVAPRHHEARVVFNPGAVQLADLVRVVEARGLRPVRVSTPPTEPAVRVGPDRPAAPWVRSPAYDGGLIIGSASITLLIIALYASLGPETNLRKLGVNQALNLMVPLLLGGPHIFFSATRTLLDREFRRQYPALIRLIPHAIALMSIALALSDPNLLMNIVFFSALLHGLTQLGHLVVRYRLNAGEHGRTGTVIDVLTITLGPLFIVSYSLHHRVFTLSGETITRSLTPLWLVYLIGMAAAGAALAFVVRGLRAYAAGQLNPAKTLLVVVTLPTWWVLMAVDNLDVTFQSYNAWHSLQYMALTWAVNASRLERGQLRSPLVARLAQPGHLHVLYGSALLFALTIGLLVLALSGFASDLTRAPWYFIIAISILLIHHAFDYFLFLRRRHFAL